MESWRQGCFPAGLGSPASGSLHLPFPLPGYLPRRHHHHYHPAQVLEGLVLPSLSLQLKLHLLREAALDDRAGSGSRPELFLLFFVSLLICGPLPTLTYDTL